MGDDVGELPGIGDAPCRIAGYCVVRSLRKVEGVRPDQYRAAAGGGLDQILSAERQQRTADQREIAGGVVGRHFPMLSPSQTCVSRIRQFALAAALQAQSARTRHCRDLIEALRMAGYDDQRQFRYSEPGRYVEDQCFLAVARAGCEPDRAGTDLGPPVVALCEPGRVGRDIELEVAGDMRTAGPDGSRRLASAAVCAATSARLCSAGRISAPAVGSRAAIWLTGVR